MKYKIIRFLRKIIWCDKKRIYVHVWKEINIFVNWEKVPLKNNKKTNENKYVQFWV